MYIFKTHSTFNFSLIKSRRCQSPITNAERLRLHQRMQLRNIYGVHWKVDRHDAAFNGGFCDAMVH
jgi:hypothetical protein